MLKRPQRNETNSRFQALLGLAAALAILALAIGWGTFHLRQTVRVQIAGRDARVLEAAVEWEQRRSQEQAAGELKLREAGDQLLLALQVSRLRGVLAVRLFDKAGKFVTAFPEYVSDKQLLLSDQQTLRALQPISRFRTKVDLRDVVAAPPGDQFAPLLDVLLPLHVADSRELIGAIELVLDGRNIAAEYAHLDRQLAIQSVAVFVTSGGLLALVLVWAWRRLAQQNRVLAERTASLVRANQELTLSAKTSALGSVTAHLMHGLTSPLTGLQNLAANRTSESDERGDWQQVISTTRLMRQWVGEVVRMLSEQTTNVEYELSLNEIVDAVFAKLRDRAQTAGVSLSAVIEVEAELRNRDANLVLLILENLLTNAIEASRAGDAVSVRLSSGGAGVVQCEVEDQGAGLPMHVRTRLFQPCQSAKAGGNGIGLAISKQLAAHLGAELTLLKTDASGTTFTLILPLEILCSRGSANTTKCA